MAEISKEERDAAKQRVIDRLVARAGVQDLAPGLEKKTPAEIQSGEDLIGKASPADFIEPYYDGHLLREILKAKHYNEAQPTLKPESYGRLFQDIPVSIRNDWPSYTPEQKGIENPSVTLSNKEAQSVIAQNADTYKEWLSAPQGSEKKKRKEAEEVIYGSGFSKPEDLKNMSAQAEHEFGHHFARPRGDISDVTGSYLPERVYHTHLSKPAELVNGLGELQRATFKATGKRFEKPEEFEKFIQSKANPDYLTPETSRIINHLRGQLKLDPAVGESYLKGVSKLVPALVENEKPKSFQDAIEKRLS